MSLVNRLYENGVNKAECLTFVQLLNPFAPHLAEELHEKFGGGMLVRTSWPTYDESKTVDDVVEVAVQINGKLKGVISVASDATEEQMLQAAEAEDKVAAAIQGMQIVKRIVIKGKIINLVVKPM